MDRSLKDSNRRTAMRFIVLVGVVSLFADVTYEAARSVAGPYLEILGASGLVVAITAGAGELLGYGLRYFSGLLSDKTRRYWVIAIAGYVVNLLAVPLLALAHHWELAAALLITERIGKGIRTPARDAMLSHAAAAVGRGWGFAIHEALDQVGAMTGPIIVTVVLAINGSYRWAFAVLAGPAFLAITVLVVARVVFPHPHLLERENPRRAGGRFPSVFWLYLAAVALVAAGFVDFQLIAFHVKSHHIVQDKYIPLLYAFAMGVDALAALVLGRLYDRKGVLVVAAAIAVSSVFALFAFSSAPVFIAAGVLLWGLGMGAHESIVRAVVADTVPTDKRGTGYGLFNTFFGIAWFLGSAIIGLLYEVSMPAVIIFSMVCQLASLPLLVKVNERLNQHRQGRD